MEAIQLRDQYEALGIEVEDHDSILPTIESDEPADVPPPAIEGPSNNPFPSMLPPQSRRQSHPEDKSEALPQPRVTDEDPHPFLLALGLWCEEAGISRTHYTSLREILRMLEPHPTLSRLPNHLAPLRRRTKGWLPQLQLRRALLPLNVQKMATIPEKQKKNTPPALIKEYLYFFDPIHLFTSILKSKLLSKMHIGLGHFRSQPIELWESYAWMASVRTTSGRFARYRNGDPIFPSDWVSYHSSPSCQVYRLGRVIEVGLEYRDGVSEVEKGTIKIKVQHALWNHEILASSFASQQFSEHDIMLLSEHSIIGEQMILSRQTNITMHYTNAPLPQPTSVDDQLICRSMINEKGWLQPLAFSAPHRAELELDYYGRDFFFSHFDAQKGSACLSLPYLLFLDGFGVYRNSYRSLMGVYIMLATLSFSERMRRANVFSITLGPHGSNLDDVLDALVALSQFDKGIILELPQPTRVCAFPLCMTGDMPQQQANAGFKTQRANRGCRFCMILADSRGDLDYDFVQHGRYHFQTLGQRRELEQIRGATKKGEFGTLWGLEIDEPALFRLFPALDIITTRPSDPAHSEYAGICKQLHHLLIDAILTPTASREYAIVLRSWPFAPGFARIQSPIHHLKSYSLSEHARWIVIIPGLLRCWLAEEHMRDAFLSALRAHLMRNDGVTVTGTIVRTFASVARSTSLLMTDELKERDQLMSTIKRARSEYQTLLTLAADATKINPRSRSMTPVRQRSKRGEKQRGRESEQNSVLPIVEGSQTQSQVNTTPAEILVKVREYENDQKRPNVHTALHYETVMMEYAMPSNINVLIGEDKHR